MRWLWGGAAGKSTLMKILAGTDKE